MYGLAKLNLIMALDISLPRYLGNLRLELYFTPKSDPGLSFCARSQRKRRGAAHHK